MIYNNLFQSLPADRYLHDLAQYAFGVLHIITLMPHSRKLMVHATLTNNRIGMAVILDIANSVVGYVDPEVCFSFSSYALTKLYKSNSICLAEILPNNVSFYHPLCIR